MKMKNIFIALLPLFFCLSLALAHEEQAVKDSSSDSAAVLAGEHPEFFFPFIPPWAPFLHPHPHWPPHFPWVPPPMPANGWPHPHLPWVPPPMPAGGKMPPCPWWWRWHHLTPPPLPAGAAGSKLPPYAWWQHFKPPHAQQDYSSMFQAYAAKESTTASNHA